jgi:hypothetical protein
MRVLVQLRNATTLSSVAPVIEGIKGFNCDYSFSPVQVPSPLPRYAGASLFALAQPMTFSFEPSQSTYLLRGQIPDDPVRQAQSLDDAFKNPNVAGVFADPAIESCPICPGDPPRGTVADVANLLSISDLASAGLDGRDVFLAVVDTGINLAYLATQGRKPTLDVQKSWTPAGVPTSPGQHPKDHGTMCAYDVGIAAPRATLVDYAVLLSRTPGQTVMSGLLSDAVAGYSNLLTLLNGMPVNSRRLVVSNSWGMFSPKWDFPVGHPGNYSDNPAHPFNIIVASLESAGADILFAAGNCGRDCPDGRCEFSGSPPICGANSHPKVISVAGIDVQKNRVGYSSQGPGRLSANKPDLAAYTHFEGSHVYPEDGGTSAACPVAAGVIAALRTGYSSAQLSPAQLRSLLYKKAEDLGPVGFDYDYGWGAIDPKAALSTLASQPSVATGVSPSKPRSTGAKKSGGSGKGRRPRRRPRRK